MNNQLPSKGLKRNTIDKFYTKTTTVAFCIDLIKKHISISDDDLIIEPSAGNGAFISDIKTLSNNHKFYDLEPENIEIIKQDFLKLQLDNNDNNIHIIGNPPFGRQSSLAIKFIKKSGELANTISFILPKSFKKPSMQKAFPPNFHLLLETDLPEKSFLIKNIEYNVPCIFQIWIRKDYNRTPIEILEPIHFRFVKINENPDISFRRVGVNAGVIDSNTNKSIQSHYFIKFEQGYNTKDNITKIKNIPYEFNNTVGPKSISKQELIYHFNKILISN